MEIKNFQAKMYCCDFFVFLIMKIVGAKKKLNKLGVENSLWNNIRAKAGSGKKPTKEMLAQEKKITKESK